MRYSEPKERSAELLRVTIGHMGRHPAAFNPLTFTLWYEYAAGINPALHAALEPLLQAGIGIDDARVVQLYQQHIAPHDEAAIQRISGELQRVLTDVSRSATRTGEHAGRFGEQLDDLSTALRSRDVAQLTPQLSEALVGTAEMRSSAQALQQQVAASEQEIARLRVDLLRARDDALLDPLTRILNRRGFEQKIAALFEQPPADGRQHCLVMLDIDHFKTVNDTHGHPMGDRVIQGLGEILRHSIAQQPHAAARYGGEEFAIVLPHSTLDDAARLAEQVRLRTKAMKIRHRQSQDVLFTVTVSGGVAALQAGDDAAALIARADAALYESKKAGRDRVSRA